MADMRRSRRPPAESSYGDVFGGPPKFSAAKPSDYEEIFGAGLTSSGSIPFLDLPPAPEASDGVGFIDYSEIFGGFDGGDFAVDYEELFGGRKKAVKSSASSNGRAPVEPKFGRRAAEFIELLPEDVSKSQAACPLKNEFSLSSNHSDDGSKQFSMSYHSTNCGSVHDVISGDTHTTHLHAVPGYSYVIDSCPSLHDLRGDDSLKTEPNDFIPSASRNGRVNDALEEKIASPTSSTDNIKGFGADLSMNRRDSYTTFTAPEDGPLNAKHHSRSSSNYSTSSGDICYTDISYVGVSDINLQTQPSRVPPPSKLPPNLSGNQESTKKKMYRTSRADHLEGNVSKHSLDHQVHYKVGAPKSRGHQGAAKDTSSCFFDVEKDASSAVAAMKEAMEQAQARLKSAKELMERQREILHSRKKQSNKEGTKCDEGEFKPSEEEKLLHDDMVKKPLQKEDKRMKESALDESKKVIEVSKGALNHEEKERYIMTTEVSQQIRQGNGFKSSKMLSKLEEVFGEWKTENQFYELVNDGMEFRVIKEAFQNQGVEKKPNHSTEGIEDMKNYSEKADMPCEFGAGKLGRGNESNKLDDDYSRAVNFTWNEETSKTPNTTLEAHTMNDNTIKLDEGCGLFHQKGTEMLQADREAFVHGEDLKEQNAAEEAFVSRESDNNAESPNDAFKVDVDYIEPEAAAEAHELDESGWTNPTSFSLEGENKLNISQGIDIHNANAINVKYKMCQGGAEEFGHVKEGFLHENSENTKDNNRYLSRDEENEPTLDRFASAAEHEESKKLNESRLSCLQAENDLESTASEPSDQVKQNLERPNQAVDTFQPTEYDNKLKLENLSCCPDSTKVDAMETLLEELQSKNAYETSSEHKNNSKPRALEGDHEGNEKDKLKGVSENIVVDEKLNILDAAQEDCRWTEIKDPGNVNHAKSLTNNEKLNSEETAEPEKECDKEKARKAEEEREREREREKDRLAVERATREARERALAEARERAERIAVERITAEARQRALADSREKAEKAAAEALEKSLAEKALKEAKLRAERAAAERAMAEARERAVEKALAEKAAADARQRAERLNAMSRDKVRKENESGDYFRASDKGNSSDVQRDARFPSAGFPGNPQGHGDTNGHGDIDSPLRCKARLERHQRTVERAAKALAEKNMRDILAQREQVERNRLAESLDADVRRWSAGKEGNLRALLSTLQYILGPESGWQPVPLTDVITGAAVKKAYRKATLCVHPDKLQQRGANIQQKYICEKVFDLLKDAWNKFHSEER